MTEFLNHLISEQKKAFEQLNRTPNIVNPFVRGLQFGKSASLVAADFKCQACGAVKDLQWHHMILRPNHHYLNDDLRYKTTRYFWKNIMILCNDCHDDYHHRLHGSSNLSIGVDKINDLKQQQKRFIKSTKEPL